MNSTPPGFDTLEQAAAQGGTDALLQQLGDTLKDQRRYHELFEVRKMQVRRRLGLPLLYQDAIETLDEPRRTQLEDGLLDACREVGMALLKRGKIREGWTYLQAVGDKPAVAEVLRTIEVNEDNLDEMVEVALYYGVDVELGFGLVLDHYGTCNSITTFESALYQHNRAQQRTAATLLVRHLHAELLSSVRADVTQRTGKTPDTERLADILRKHPELTAEGSYHIDVSHLSSTVRFSRLLETAEDLQLALDLTCYGRTLAEQFQYKGEPPFAEVYPSHQLYFAALLGQQVDEAIAYFRQQATAAGPEQGTAAIEVFIDLLDRLGRPDEALQAALSMIQPDQLPAGLAPTMLQLARQANQLPKFLDYCRDRQDLLGFGTALAVQAER